MNLLRPYNQLRLFLVKYNILKLRQRARQIKRNTYPYLKSKTDGRINSAYVFLSGIRLENTYNKLDKLEEKRSRLRELVLA